MTIDGARILRVPGTFNYKTQSPAGVKLASLGQDYAFEQALGHIKAAPTSVFTVAVKKPIGLDLDMSIFPPKPIPPEGIENLSEGINTSEDVPLDPIPIFKHCPFFRDAVLTKGRDHTQPLWHLAVLSSTFWDEGQEWAHYISKGYPRYTREETQAMFDRKMRDRHERGLGWPGCKAFEDNGCKLCDTCVHRGKIKSPMHLVLSGAAPDVVSQDGFAKDSNQGNQWPDPLDFDVVPVREAVERINAAGYFVLTLNGDIYKIEPHGGVAVQKRDGFNNVFSCRHARGDDGKLLQAGNAWRSSRRRCEYDRIGYWPEDHDRPVKSYNLWQGWGVEPVQGDWSVIYRHVLNVIANGNKATANFILDWCAHMVQRSWEKPGVALVLKGRKGTGKTLLTRILAAIIGRQNTLITANGKKLFAQFNWHLADKLLIGAEEAFFAGNRELNDQLKHLLTGDEIEVEQKFGQRISIKSMHRVIMTSNHDQVLAASDDERRFFVCNVSNRQRGDDIYFAALVRILNGEDNRTLAAFMYELKTRDITDWKAERAARGFASADLADQKLLSLEPPLQWLLETVLEAPPIAATAIAEDACHGEQLASTWQRQKDEMLGSYREWARRTQVRGASDFTGAEIFWRSIKRLLNDEIFPGRRLFHSSGGKRSVLLPSRQELVDGFNRLLGANVLELDDDFKRAAPAPTQQVSGMTLPAVVQAQPDLALLGKSTTPAQTGQFTAKLQQAVKQAEADFALLGTLPKPASEQVSKAPPAAPGLPNFLSLLLKCN